MKEIQLTQGQVALVDDEDFEYLNQWRWCAHWSSNVENYYAVRGKRITVNGKSKINLIRMHRLIMNAPKDKQVDHINHDTLDNQRNNLRIVSNRQNSQNRKCKYSSIYPGVTWDKINQKWAAGITINGKHKSLGRFEEEKEAAKTYERVSREMFGEELACKMGSSK